ncbi:MAG: Gfo/Idh/MocA family oxidoreductase [Armatimonadetes bacterium]|nr:Gfo/Idh/MocA family oxidoreductase [Armatimonadota bacterium]
MQKLRVAIIGQGRSGRSIHVDHIQKLPRMFEIVAVVDPLEIRRDWAVKELGCEAYEDYKPLLKRRDLDLVVNATPSNFHVPYALELLKSGHNVLVEKPLAKTVADVDRLIAAAKKAGKVLAIFQQSRFAPYFHQVKKVIDSGVLGRIVQISCAFSGFGRRWDWQTLTEWHGGNLMNTGPHPLDQLLRLLDLPTDQVPQVFCHLDRGHFWGDADAHVHLAMRAENRPLIMLEISSCCAYPMFTYHVYGTQGGLKGGYDEVEWKYYKPAEAPKREATAEPIRNPDGSPAYCGEELKWHTKTWQVPKGKSALFQTLGIAYYRNLHSHVTSGEPLVVTPDQVRQQIAVIEQCHKQNPDIWGKKK